MARAESNDTKMVRDPFWPVGYQHIDTTSVVVVAAPVVTNVAPVVETSVTPAKPDPLQILMQEKELAAKIRTKCQVSAFMKAANGQQIAVVNGQVVSVGDRMSVDVEGHSYRFKVTAVSATFVKLEPVK